MTWIQTIDVTSQLNIERQRESERERERVAVVTMTVGNKIISS